MESLLLKENIITLKGIREVLYGVTESESVETMQLIPNGLFSSDSNHSTINRTLTSGEYSDSVVLKKDKDEYPIFYGANSRGANPVCISYGKKVGERLILLQEIFSNQSLYSANPEMIRCSFFNIDSALAYGKLFTKLKGQEIFYIYADTDEKNKRDLTQAGIGKHNMEALEECVNAYNRVFVLKRASMSPRNPW